MSINHHPDEATLLSYAAGSLPLAFELLVACHLRSCPQCQQRVAQAEALGGMLLDALEPVPVEGRDELMKLMQPIAGDNPLLADDMALETMPHDEVGRAEMGSALTTDEPWRRAMQLPEPLQQFIDQGDQDMPWRRLVPGIQQIMLNRDDGQLRLLKIAPGISIPLHSHEGSEMTLILQGSYSDELGRFQAGDVADLEPDVEHQPITDGSEPCICLVATDAPLRFNGLLPRILQPFTGF